MTVTIKLTQEQHKRVKERAEQRGIEPADYVRELIERDSGSGQVAIGQKLLDQWESDGTLGLFSDRPDSPEFARELRRRAELRG